MFNRTEIRNLLLALSIDPKDTFWELEVGINSFYHRYDRILGRVSTHLKRCLIVFPEKAISYFIIYIKIIHSALEFKHFWLLQFTLQRTLRRLQESQISS